MGRVSLLLPVGLATGYSCSSLALSPSWQLRQWKHAAVTQYNAIPRFRPFLTSFFADCSRAIGSRTGSFLRAFKLFCGQSHLTCTRTPLHTELLESRLLPTLVPRSLLSLSC